MGKQQRKHLAENWWDRRTVLEVKCSTLVQPFLTRITDKRPLRLDQPRNNAECKPKVIASDQGRSKSRQGPSLNGREGRAKSSERCYDVMIYL